MAEPNVMAAFNLAMPYLERINLLLSEISSSYRNGDSLKMMFSLRSLYREIAPKLNSTERKDMKTKFGDLKKKRVITMKEKEDFFEELEEIDIQLRDYLEARGMLIPNSSDPRFMFGQKQK